MIWFKCMMIVLLLAVIGFLAWSWQMGPMRVKRDITAFAGMMQTCTAFNQDFKDALSGQTMNRAITGPKEDTCGVTMDTYSPKGPRQVIGDLRSESLDAGYQVAFNSRVMSSQIQ